MLGEFWNMLSDFAIFRMSLGICWVSLLRGMNNFSLLKPSHTFIIFKRDAVGMAQPPPNTPSVNSPPAFAKNGLQQNDCQAGAIPLKRRP